MPSSSPKTEKWEQKLCAGLLLVLLVAVGTLLFRWLREPEPGVSPAPAAPNVPSLFSDQAFAFLYPPVLPDTERNLFRFRRSFPKPHDTRPSVTPTPNPTTSETPRPPPPKPQRRLHFSGWMEVPDQARVAFLEIADPRSGASLHRGPVRVGDKVAGFTVLAVESDTVRVRDNTGSEHVLALRKPLTLDLP